ncbi:MAG: hypothetical protein ACQEXQ_02705 [Bacillota bacterium]
MNDIQNAEIGTQDISFILRVERAGAGIGVFTITHYHYLYGNRQAGNTAVVTDTVTVPDNKSKKK